jgi:hypothetical protein
MSVCLFFIGYRIFSDNWLLSIQKMTMHLLKKSLTHAWLLYFKKYCNSSLKFYSLSLCIMTRWASGALDPKISTSGDVVTSVKRFVHAC